MTTGRVLWIIWCLFWAGMWALGALTVIAAPICLPLVVLSLFAILLPVGRPLPPQQARCPFCGASGEPTLMPLHLQAAHGHVLPYAAPQPAPQLAGHIGSAPAVVIYPQQQLPPGRM